MMKISKTVVLLFFFAVAAQAAIAREPAKT
jgi:hypothetical protein